MADPAPLKTSALARRAALKPESDPPAEVTLAFGGPPLPTGATLSVARGRKANLAQLEVALPGRLLGKRSFPADVAIERVTAAKAAKVAKAAKIVPEGRRPGYLPVAFRPERVVLKKHERARPPAGFDFRRGKELLDRPTNVFPPDTRYIYQDTAFPWCTVGRVDTPLGWATGCTIGSRLLLTANHAIQWNPNNTAGWVRFRPSYYNGSAPFGEAWATRVIFWTKTTPADGLSDTETAFDYVVCVLDRRIGDVVGYPGYRAYSSSWNGGSYWQHMGYPSDLSGGERPAFVGSAVVSSTSSQSTSGQSGLVLGHFNDIVGGHSGGPVWGWWGTEPWPRVVGTQSAEANVPANNTSGDNEFGGGSALSSLISWARSNYG